MLIPQHMMKSYEEITPQWLRSRGLEAVCADLDNTLAGYGEKTPSARAKLWVDGLKAAGIPVGIASNNHSGKRVRAHAAALGVAYVSPARKPGCAGLLRLAAELGAEPSRCAMVGDQIFTDTLAAHRAGMVSIRVPPVKRDFLSIIRFAAEWPFLLAGRRRNSQKQKK